MWHGYVLKIFTVEHAFCDEVSTSDANDACIYFRRLCLLIGHRCSFRAMQNFGAKLKIHCVYVGAALPPLKKRVTCVATTTALNKTII